MRVQLHLLRRNLKQQGRPISSMFITQDLEGDLVRLEKSQCVILKDELTAANTIYRQAKSDVDIKRTFK